MSSLPNQRETALEVGKAIVNSPLVKTAIHGNDPNVGRLLSALGDFLGTRNIEVDPKTVTISLGGTEIYDSGCFRLDKDKEARLPKYLAECQIDPSHKGYPEHDRTVDIEIKIGVEAGEATVLGADLSYDYIRENAEYRS